MYFYLHLELEAVAWDDGVVRYSICIANVPLLIIINFNITKYFKGLDC
jgi:hypothetical protein